MTCLPVTGFLPAVRQRGRHHREVVRVHGDGALAGVDVGGDGGVVVEPPVGVHELARWPGCAGWWPPPTCRPPRRRSSFRPAKASWMAEDARPLLLAGLALDEAGGGDGAGVHEGVHLLPLICSMATMELKTCPVASTPILSRTAVAPAVSSTLASVKTLEIDWMENGRVDVPLLEGLAVDGDERDAEELRVDLGERRDVVGVLALVEGPVLLPGGVDGRGVGVRAGAATTTVGSAVVESNATVRAASTGFRDMVPPPPSGGTTSPR